MRIDSAKGTQAWLTGNFSGSFKGDLEGGATFAQAACTAVHAISASHMGSKEFAHSLEESMEDPDNQSVFEKLVSQQKLIVSGGIRVYSGSVEIDSGSLRIRKVRLEYVEDDDALTFTFGAEPDPPVPPVPPEPPTPPVPPLPPYPPFPPYPPYPPFPPPYPPPPFPPGPWICKQCPRSGSCWGSGSSKPKQCSLSIDYFRSGSY